VWQLPQALEQGAAVGLVGEFFKVYGCGGHSGASTTFACKNDIRNNDKIILRKTIINGPRYRLFTLLFPYFIAGLQLTFSALGLIVGRRFSGWFAS
jgi:hypothetical protein